MNAAIIYLAGFMGSGKSTIGPILANTLGWDFFDLDKVIEQRAAKKIKEIFDESGEPYFRNLETETLIEVSRGRNLIIALGGGTIANEKNLEFIKRTGKIIYLKASPEHVYERLKHKRDRPVLLKNGAENLTKSEFIEKVNTLYNERRKYYERADYTINTDNIPIGKTVDQLAKLILKDSKKDYN
ncbi:MAG: shikimate kinase [Ignavibacteriaceae bacterium]